MSRASHKHLTSGKNSRKTEPELRLEAVCKDSQSDSEWKTAPVSEPA